MADLRIADGLYLVHKNIPTTAQSIKTELPTDHIVVIDCSGSMHNELPQIRQHLKNKLPMMVKPADTVSIVWFSGKTQYGIVVEAVEMRTAVDLSGVHRAIDNFLKPVCLTGFVEPLQEVKRVVGRLQKPGRAINLFFMSDGHDNQWPQTAILEAIDELQAIVSSAAIVEYGFYCNRPLMVKMAERLGASEVLADNFPQYEPIFETAMTKKIIGGKKIEVHLHTKPLHGFAFTVGDGEILSFAIDDRDMVLVPEATTDVYWLSETPSTTQIVQPDDYMHIGQAKPLAGRYHQPLYASLVPLTQRMLSNDIFRVLKATGDVRLIRQFANCFGKQAYTDFQTIATECVFDASHRLVDGYDPNEVPPEDAYTVLDLLYLLASDEGNQFFPSHLSYERIGRKAVETDHVLNESESQRIGEIAARLSQTRDPKEVLELQKELSTMVETRKTLHFVADKPGAGYPITSLVFNEDRPNVSVQTRIPGTIDISDELPTGMMFSHPMPLVNFPTSIVRTYTIIRDGIRNIQVLPVTLTENSYRVLVENGVVPTYPGYLPGMIYGIDLSKIPLINRKMVGSVSAKSLFQKQYALLKAKAAQKVLNHYFDQNFPAEATKGIVDKYGAEAAAWLSGLGIKDYGYSPKVELAEATESYYGKELTVSLAGLSSLPAVKSILDKLDAGKKLTTRESLLAAAIAEVNGYMARATLDKVDDKTKTDLFKVWLTSRKRDTVALCRQLMREVAEVKFSVIVGQVWFHEFASLDENTLTMQFDGIDIACAANLNEIEIKI